MYTKGKQPYEGMRGDEVVAFVEKGMFKNEMGQCKIEFNIYTLLMNYQMSYFISIAI